MSALGSLVVSLSANIAKFEASMNRAQHVANQSMGRISRDVSGMKSSFDAIPGTIGKIVTSAAALTGIAYVFKKAIGAVDDYRVSIVGIASTLTDMSKPGQGSMEEVFKRNKAYAEEMYKAITLESAKHFATQREMMMVYNRLVQSGYAVRLDEVALLGVLTDQIKLKTKGQEVEKQLNTEILALMEGQARPQSMLALELKSRLGPGWADLVRKHREAGDLLKWMGTLWPGLQIASKEVTKTLDAQWNTTKSLLDLLSIRGLGGAYDDIVGMVTRINAFLKEHEATIAGGIVRGWELTKDIVGSVYAIVSEVLGVMKELVVHAYRFAEFWSGLSASGPWMKMAKWFAESEGGQALAGGAFGGVQAEGFVGPPAPPKGKGISGPPPAVSPPSPGGGKGGGGGRAQELAGIAEIAAADFKKIETIMNSIYDAAERNIKEIDSYLESQERLQTDSLNLQKDQFDALAQSSPVLQDQIAFKQKALDLEIQINQATFDKKLLELQNAHIIEKAQGDELRGLQALINATKKYNLEMENNKGLAGWAWSRNKESDQKNSVKDLMGGAENFLSQAFSSGLQGVLSKDKNSLKDIGKTMFQGFLGEIHKGGITRTFNALAKVISPGKGKKDLAGNDLMEAGNVLSGAGLQLATSAGGLLLSGIGIMTNSQALVVAGTVLQLAGLAIQLYQMLTATTQMTAATALMGSAALLDAAAMALMFAAATEAVPFLHGGGVIYAHTGWPRLRSDEVPIVAQTGERVLSRSQNRDYEAGMRAGGGGASTVVNAPITITINPRQAMTQRDYDKHIGMIMKSLDQQMGRYGEKLKPGR